MPCTFVGWSHPSCGGLGKGNIPEKELKNPAVIKKYGGYGVDANSDGYSDPYDLEDAIFSTAHYLNKSGFETNVKKAVRAYNHSDKYVADVVHYAELFTSTQGEIPPISDGTFTRPASGPITSDYGQRSGGMHHGVDIGKRANVVPIVAAADGTVSRSYVSSSYGEAIFIEHTVEGQKWETVYAHMVSGSRRVQVGDLVKKGQTIGLMGNTGQSTGPHLHFEIHVNGGWNIKKSNSISPTKSGLIEW
jgi:murein DD-endopeptidase MepM/ murein hydrolase activator NlpD